MPSNLDKNVESRKFLFGMRILAVIGCLLILLYSLRFWASGQLLRIFGVGTLLAGAALLSGFLLGFIFSIPRFGGQKEETTTAQAPDTGARRDPVLFNANLVEISDWLTKIIVGVGLVELHAIPNMLGKLSYYLAPGLQPDPCAAGAPCTESLVSGQAAGLAIVIFYFALGFLMGYVWTMIFFRQNLLGQFDLLERREHAAIQMVPPKASVVISAEASVSANKLDEATASIDEALRNDPNNGTAIMTKARILKRQALQSKKADRENLLQEAIAYADQAIHLLPDKGEPIYNKACYQALLDVKDLKNDVLANLKSAFGLNPALRQAAKQDDDLASLRGDVDFIRLVDVTESPGA